MNKRTNEEMNEQEMPFRKKMRTVIAQQQQRMAKPWPANDRLYSPNADYYNYIIWDT